MAGEMPVGIDYISVGGSPRENPLLAYFMTQLAVMSNEMHPCGVRLLATRL